MELLKHQLEAVEKLHNGSILYGNVGSGKSLTAAAYYMKCESPKNVYVITTAKKRDSLDWEGTFARFGIGIEVSVGGLLTIDSWNNLYKYLDVEDAFFIFDEQRLVGSGVWVKTFLKIAKKNNWIMLTATPGDTWMDYIPVFIANGLYKNRTQFILEHVVYAPYVRFPKIVRYMGVRTLEKYRNMLLVEAPFINHTTRIFEDVETTYDFELFAKAYTERWHVYEHRPIKDVSELFRVMRRIISSDPSRLNAVRALMEKHPKLIIFYNYDYELDILRGLKDEITVAEWNGHRKELIPKSEKWVYLVQYVAGAEAWNCIETNAIIFFSLTYSYKTFIQAQGRIDRLDTLYTDLYYYILTSNSIVDRAVKKSLENKKIFNEKVFLEEFLKSAV